MARSGYRGAHWTDKVGSAWMNEEADDSFQEGLQAKSHTLGIVKGTVYLRTRVHLRGMERKTA